MTLTPWNAGATLPTAHITCAYDDGTAVDLTSATITMIIESTDDQIRRNATGSFAILNPSTGDILYSWTSGDTSTPGNYLLLITVTYPSEQKIKFDPIPWQVVPS